jgi:hypothetical protein
VREDRLAEHLGGPDVGVGADVDLAGVAEERGTVLTADLVRTKWILVLAIAGSFALIGALGGSHKPKPGPAKPASAVSTTSPSPSE